MLELEKRIFQLKEKLLFMASVVEQMIRDSIKSLVERDEELAKKIIEEEEPKVNQLEIDIDDMCIKLLALYQPEASDLRIVTMVMKINIDLERVGDHAVNIAGTWWMPSSPAISAFPSSLPKRIISGDG